MQVMMGRVVGSVMLYAKIVRPNKRGSFDFLFDIARGRLLFSAAAGRLSRPADKHAPGPISVSYVGNKSIRTLYAI